MATESMIVEQTINVSGYDKEAIAMTIGASGKNFINWTENTPGINYIWHNKEQNIIEIRGDQDGEFSNVIRKITNVLNFNTHVIANR